MISKNLLLIFVLFLFTRLAFAAPEHEHHGAVSEDRYFVHVNVADRETRSKLASFIHIDSVIENSAYAVVNEYDLRMLKKNFGKLIVESHQLEIKKAEKGQDDTYEFPKGDEAYHTYEEVIKAIDDYARAYPDICEKFTFGSTVEGQSIPAIRITAAENRQSGAFIPGILFTGAHHAREHLSVEVPMKLIGYLLENYSKDAAVKKLISTRDIYFVPMLNIDGAMYDIKGKRYKMWRKNRVENSGGSYGVDLNRNYSFGWGTGGSSRSESSDVFMGPKPFSEPETQAVKSFVETHANIKILLSFHTYSELILYPWGGKYDDVVGKDGDVFKKMAKTMAAWNRYKPQQASDLYIASGDTCDWAYGEHKIFCFTFELTPKGLWGGGFYPGTSVIESTFNVNVKPALYLIEHAADPYGVLSGKPTLF